MSVVKAGLSVSVDDPQVGHLSYTLAPGGSEFPRPLWGTAPQLLLSGLGPGAVEGLILVLGLTMGKGIPCGPGLRMAWDFPPPRWQPYGHVAQQGLSVSLCRPAP